MRASRIKMVFKSVKWLALILIILHGCKLNSGLKTMRTTAIYGRSWTEHTFRPLTRECFINDLNYLGEFYIESADLNSCLDQLDALPMVPNSPLNCRFGLISGMDTILVSRDFRVWANGRTVEADTCDIWKIISLVPGDTVERATQFKQLFECE